MAIDSATGSQFQTNAFGEEMKQKACFGWDKKWRQEVQVRLGE